MRVDPYADLVIGVDRLGPYEARAWVGQLIAPDGTVIAEVRRGSRANAQRAAVRLLAVLRGDPDATREHRRYQSTSRAMRQPPLAW